MKSESKLILLLFSCHQTCARVPDIMIFILFELCLHKILQFHVFYYDVFFGFYQQFTSVSFHTFTDS